MQTAAPLETIVSRLRLHAARRPQATAFRFLADGESESDALTYVELDRRARAIAVRLQQAGAAGERVLLLLPQDLRFITAFFGCLYAQAVAVPMAVPRAGRPMQGLLAIAGDAAPSAVLTTQDIRNYLEPRFAVEFPEAQWLSLEDIGDDGDGWSETPIAEDALAFLQYTSGSTGAPKGVMVSHANLAHNAEVMRQALSIDERSIYGGWLPTYHDMGLIGMVLGPAYFGVPSILMPPLVFLQKPARWLQLISRYRVTVSGGPNFAYNHCLERIADAELPGLDLSSWTIAFNGSEPVRVGTVERFHERFAVCGLRTHAAYPCYGMAEATLFVSGHGCAAPVALTDFDADALQWGRGAGQDEGKASVVGCGKAWHGMRIEIVDPANRRPVEPGAVGEIWIAGGSVAQGYFRRPDLTAETFDARLADGRGPYLRSGDLGFTDDGALFVTGRLKDIVIVRGRNYYPQDIEATAERSNVHLQPGAATAFAVEHQGEERLVLVHEVTRAGLAAQHRDVAGDILEAVTAEFGLALHDIVLVKPAAIPKTSSGKLRRAACKALYQSGELAAVYAHRARNRAGQTAALTGATVP